ncbi:MAG: hypothetical protein Q7K45_02970, partial [Nanoarchaeota archaeon]|nr:hypothetical protein [Nanoarchaeota archaeon]
DDSLQGLLWQPVQPKYNLDGVMEKIKDKMWKVKYKENKNEEKKIEKPAGIKPEVIKFKIAEPTNSPLILNAQDEIKAAIEKIQGK